MEYRKLNDQQKKAVDEIDGPVLVVAGPGTGKTQLLSARVANILKQTDTDPANILCLTFTNKAALNMRERLHQLIGSQSRFVVVKTFHSFAAELINNYPDYFWNGARLSVAPDAVQLEIIQNLLAGLPLDNPLSSTFAGAFTQLPDVKQALKLAKEAGLTPEELRQVVSDNLVYLDKLEPVMVDLLTPPLSTKKLPQLEAGINKLPPHKTPPETLLLPLDKVIQESLLLAIDLDEPTGKTIHTGKWKKRWLQTVDGQKGMFDELRRNQWWLAVADVYENYRTQLHERGYYDYSDMMIEVIEQLSRNADMRADVQERFQYVLIDEFQDTNAAQLRLAHLVADHYAANNRPNLMAVGDDDQSIFAFNGAELNNMLSFRRSYPDTKLIVLDKNYRSSQKVLDTATQIITQAEDRLVNRERDITKKLTAENEPKVTSNIEHVSYPTRQHQQLAISKRVKELWKAGEGSVAVLARTHDSLQQQAGILSAQDVAISYERRGNVLEHSAVLQVYAIASAALAISSGDKKQANLLLSKLIRHPMWDISPKSLWKLATDNYSSPDWLASLFDSGDPKLSNIALWLSWLGRSSGEQPLTISLEYILGLREDEYMESPFRGYFLSNRTLSPEYLECLSAIEQLRGLAQEFSAHSDATLEDFVRFIELNDRTGQVISDESWFNSGEKSVELLTIYKAKGLEFDHVFVIDAVEDMWRPRTARRKSPANLRLESYGEKYDDYVRLLYVAASRAKSTLTVSSYRFSDSGADLLPSPLLAALPLKTIDQPEEEVQEVLEADLRWPRLTITDEKALLAGRLEKFYLSPTSLTDFLDVTQAGPAVFMERHLLRLPRASSPEGGYGTAIHAALETAQRLVNTVKLELDTVLERFEASLEEQRLAPAEFDLYKNKGRGLLTELINKKLLTLPKGSLAEQSIKDVLIGEARLGGKLDRLDLPDKNTLIISDYKTGKALSSFDTKDKTKEHKAWRSRYQLLFYCLLAQGSSRYGKVKDVSGKIIYVEAPHPDATALTLVPTEQELEELSRLVQVVWKHIINLDFPDVSSYSPDMAGIQSFTSDLIKSQNL
mgnify:CR=1 FL=1